MIIITYHSFKSNSSKINKDGKNVSINSYYIFGIKSV